MSDGVLRRRAARVVLLDESGRVLLMAAKDPADARKGSWWEIPGGGIDHGEDTSRRRPSGALRGDRDLRRRDRPVRVDPTRTLHVRWLAIRPARARPRRLVDGVDLSLLRPGGLEAFEAIAFSGHRWWGLDDLMISEERVLPVRLREFLPDLVAGPVLPVEPLDITHTGPGPFD